MKKTVQTKTAGNKPALTKNATATAAAPLAFPRDLAATVGRLAGQSGMTPETYVAQIVGEVLRCMEHDANQGRTCFAVLGFDPHTWQRIRMAAGLEEANGDPRAWIVDDLTAEGGALESAEDAAEADALEAAHNAYCDRGDVPANSVFRVASFGQYRRMTPVETEFKVVEAAATDKPGTFAVLLKVKPPWAHQAFTFEAMLDREGWADLCGAVAHQDTSGEPAEAVGFEGRCIIQDDRHGVRVVRWMKAAA